MPSARVFLLLLLPTLGGLLAGCATGRLNRAGILPGAQRVVVLGDSITHSGQYVDFIEAYFVTRFPNRKVEILNVGLPSETVSGLSEPGHADGKFPRPHLHERLGRVLEQTQPDVVLACYGMNDGIYLPFSDERFARFTNGLIRLRNKVLAAGARMIHVTPPTFDEARGKGPGYGTTLDRYAEWMLAQRGSGWEVIDVHAAMNRFLAERRKVNPNYFLASDGVHPGDEGHWLMAQAVLSHLGASDVRGAEGPKAILEGYPNAPEILKLVQQKQRVLRDAWLTATGHKRPGMPKGLSLSEAERKAAEIDARIRETLAGTP
jgi:lysophospholipase L1-like esterase